MANEKNLIPLNQRTKSEQRKIQSQGGKARAESERRRKTARECAEIYLSLPVSDMRKWNRMSREGVSPDDMDNMMLLVASMIKAGQAGDVAAFNAVLRVLGEDKSQPLEERDTGVIEIGTVLSDETEGTP